MLPSDPLFCAVARVSRVLCPLRDDGHLSVRPVAGNAPGRRFPRSMPPKTPSVKEAAGQTGRVFPSRLRCCIG